MAATVNAQTAIAALAPSGIPLVAIRVEKKNSETQINTAGVLSYPVLHKCSARSQYFFDR
jgi:hypothetical protein